MHQLAILQHENHFKLIFNNDEDPILALRMPIIYPLFRKYCKDYSYQNEILRYENFIKQVTNSEYYINGKSLYFRNSKVTSWCILLDFKKLHDVIDTETFLMKNEE